MGITALWKGIVLRGIGLFLFALWMRGDLPLYIHERFVWLVVVASIGLVWIGAIYHSRRVGGTRYHHLHETFSWGGLLLVLLPIVCGLTVPRKPLGAEAMRKRSVNAESMMSLAAPGTTRTLSKPNAARTILDWALLFLSEPDSGAFAGERADVTGFVYRDAETEAEFFLLSRFVLTCCVADAAPVSLPVLWSESGTLANDQWARVAGHFAIHAVEGQPTPVLVADTVTLIDMPKEPYLYP
jgi:uncharacterized repeat protein (TIGR03943 family)